MNNSGLQNNYVNATSAHVNFIYFQSIYFIKILTLFKKETSHHKASLREII